MPLSSKILIRDEGTLQGPAKILDFVGAGVAATVVGGIATITIGGGGSPGGSTTQVQYNNAGAFGGITGATTDGTTLTLVAPVLGTPASGNLANCTFPTLNQNTSGSAASLSATNTVARGGTGLTTIAALSTWVADALDTPLVITPGAGNSIRINAGGTAWEAFTPVSGGATLNGITAATGAVTIANANNTGIVWNWANTTDSTVAFTFGETTAGTNGTHSTGFSTGIPNQVLLKCTTLANSTQSPFSAYSRGVHVFSISATTAQTIHTTGTVSLPSIAWETQPTTGIYFSANDQMRFASDGAECFAARGGYFAIANRALSFTVPHINAFPVANVHTGITMSDTVIGIGFATAESLRWTAGVMQPSKGSADAVSYALNFRKSRGQVSVPTVITTGDDLATISAYGYVGATNTYREATRIRSDSIGTVSDATTGVGGEIVLGTMKQGVDTAAVDRFKVDQFGHLVSLIGTANTPTISAGGGTNPAITGTDNAFVVTIGTGGTATSVTVTFGTAYVTNPPCVQVESDTDLVAFKVVPAVGSVTIDATLAFTAGSKLYCTVLGML